jgi:hypothetical protein
VNHPDAFFKNFAENYDPFVQTGEEKEREMNRSVKEASHALDQKIQNAPTPPPHTIFSNCGKLLQIIYKTLINNRLRDQLKIG